MSVKIKRVKVIRTNAVTYQVSNVGGVLGFTLDGRKVDRLPVGILTTNKSLVNRVRPTTEWIIELLAKKRNRSTEGISLELDEAARDLVDYLDDKFTPRG